MIERTELARMRPAERAELIVAQARSELSSRLWRAALGDGADSGPAMGASESSPLENSLQLLLKLIDEDRAPLPSQPPAAADSPADRAAAEPEVTPLPSPSQPLDGLGANARYQASLERAAERTRIPGAALAAIVDAEAAKGRDGAWKTHSRNPRSSAAGLGQFLSGTWIGEAERSGTWLNARARAEGWIGQNGKVLPYARSELLALRYDADASINAIADYARVNLDRLREAGVRAADSVKGIAEAAYLGHHLGLGDAVRFMKQGLAPGRARMLLHAQIGGAGAERRIAEAGNATEAHREWLMGFIDRRIQPARFASLEGAASGD